MKFIVTMKDPDGFSFSVQQAVSESIPDGLSQEERDLVVTLRAEKIKLILDEWFYYDEYINLEIDTDAETCIVVSKS